MKKTQLIYFLILVLSILLNACRVTLNPDFNNTAVSETTSIETPPQTTTALPQSPTALVEWVETPFEICAESKTWRRPTEEQQAQTWWRNGRYAGVDQSLITYYWTHNFLLDYGNAVDAFDNLNLSGLWTEAENLAKCQTNDQTTRALANGDKSRIWLLHYKALSVTTSGQNIKFTVVSTERGYQIILIPRLKKKPLTFIFQDVAGREIDSIVENKSPFAYPWATE